MADVKPIPTSGFNFSSINGILNLILTSFQIPEPPVEPLPPPLIMVGAKLRPGISAQAIASEVISKQSDAGRVVGDVFADGPNVEEAMELIRVQQIVNTILNEAKVDVVIPPGVAVTAFGGNAGGPVVCQGFTTAMGIGDGIIR
jgi:hypothetical protein